MQDEDEVLKELRLAEMELEDVDAGWISESGQIEALRNALRHMLKAIQLRSAMKVRPS
jgi:hypothetical protein